MKIEERFHLMRRAGIACAAWIIALVGIICIETPIIAQIETCAPRKEGRHYDRACRFPPNVLLAEAENCASKNKGESCERGDEAKGYAILKDIDKNKPKAFLLIPAKCVTGIEDLQLTGAYTNLWDEAWQWADRFPHYPFEIGLAVNSMCRRSIDQLHIHISCVKLGVREALREMDQLGKIKSYPEEATPIDKYPPYTVVKVHGLTAEHNPFNVVRKMTIKSEMARQSIAVIAASNEGDYYVLNGNEENGGGHAEDLLDQFCTGKPTGSPQLGDKDKKQQQEQPSHPN